MDGEIGTEHTLALNFTHIFISRLSIIYAPRTPNQVDHPYICISIHPYQFQQLVLAYFSIVTIQWEHQQEFSHWYRLELPK